MLFAEIAIYSDVHLCAFHASCYLLPSGLFSRTGVLVTAFIVVRFLTSYLFGTVIFIPEYL